MMLITNNANNPANPANPNNSRFDGVDKVGQTISKNRVDALFNFSSPIGDR